jgi:hypothetical protein
MIDKKAKSILFKTYWSAQGWKKEYSTEQKDLEYAKSKGLMFDPITITLEELKAELNSLINRIDNKKIVDGFISSLTNKRLDWRSALASYFNAKLILEGKREVSDFVKTNKFENEDINILNFERLKWGGVRYSRLIYNYVDLKIFEKEEISKPTKEDIDIFNSILNSIDDLNNGEYPGKLRDNLKDIVKGNKYERMNILEILGCCEILNPKSYDRATTGRHDWEFMEYWRGGDGFDNDIIKEYFGNYLK